MNRDLIIGLLVALLLHAGLALGGNLFKSPPSPPAPDDTIPIIELAPLPPLEPDPVEMSAPAGEAGGDLSDIVPPMQADTPAPTTSSFIQQIQPPPPPGITRSASTIVIPTRPVGGLGTGSGGGFKNLFDLATLDQPPVPRSPIQPFFPQDMNRAGINGEVVVGFIVDSEGNVQNPFVVSSSHREFESEALRAVSRTKFKPGRKNGAYVSTRNVRITITFKISGN
ncbi:MAG: energy transducer TonB [Opitutaceae bacterium]|jgi:protein TonB